MAVYLRLFLFITILKVSFTAQPLLNFTLEPEEVVYPLKRESFVWPCQAGGDLPINITWEKNGVPVNDPRRHVLADGSLYFAAVDGRRHRNPDEDNYACIIRNRHGALRSRTVRLVIPRFGSIQVEPPGQTIAAEGGNARFQCILSGVVPLPANIIWQKDRRIISSSDRFVILPSGVLQVHNLSLDDTGKYRCIAKNPAKRSKSPEAFLQVTSSTTTPATAHSGITLSKLPSAILAQQPQNVTMLKSQTAILECMVNGKFRRPENKVTVVWSKQDQYKKFSHKHMVWDNLKLGGLELSDSGTYLCTISVNKTVASQQVAHLTVRAPPRFTINTPILKRPPGFNGGFTCSGKGNPLPEVRWYKDGKLIEMDDRIKHFESPWEDMYKVVFKDVTILDSGFYQCIGNNSLGSTQASSVLEIIQGQQKVDRPRHLNVTMVASRQVELQWREPAENSNKVIAYSLHYESPYQAAQSIVDSPLTAHVLNQLQPNTNYSFYIVAYSSSAASPSSNVVHATTLEDIPEEPPLFNLSSASPYTVDVAWQPLPSTKANGEIIKYRIDYQTSEEDTVHSEEVDGREVDYQLSGLVPDTPYRVRLLAATRVGYCQSSEEYWVKVRTRPKETNDCCLPNLNFDLSRLNSTSVMVTWDDLQSLEGALGYRLFYGTTKHPLEGLFNFTITTSHFTITNLEPATWYEFHMSVFSATKMGPMGVHNIQTLSREQDPKEPPLLPPHRVSVLSKSDTSAHIAWLPPPAPTPGQSHARDGIEFYELKYQPLVASQANASAVNAHYKMSSEPAVFIFDLTPSTEYEIMVRSFSHGGASSPFSSSIICRTRDPKLGPPLLLFLQPTSFTSVYVKWAPSQNSLDQVSYYNVLYTGNLSLPLSEWSRLAVDRSDWKADIGQLQPGREYYFVVESVSSSGQRSASHRMSVQLPRPSQGSPPPSRQPSTNPPGELVDPSVDMRSGIFIGVFVSLALVILTLVVVSIIKCRMVSTGSREVRVIPPTSTDRSSSSFQMEYQATIQEYELELLMPMLTQSLDTKGSSDRQLRMLRTPGGDGKAGGGSGGGGDSAYSSHAGSTGSCEDVQPAAIAAADNTNQMVVPPLSSNVKPDDKVEMASAPSLPPLLVKGEGGGSDPAGGAEDRRSRTVTAAIVHRSGAAEEQDGDARSPEAGETSGRFPATPDIRIYPNRRFQGEQEQEEEELQTADTSPDFIQRVIFSP